jgi:hypothetical protein
MMADTTLEVGASATVQLSKLDLTSLGSPVTTAVSASFEARPGCTRRRHRWAAGSW